MNATITSDRAGVFTDHNGKTTKYHNGLGDFGHMADAFVFACGPKNLFDQAIKGLPVNLRARYTIFAPRNMPSAKYYMWRTMFTMLAEYISSRAQIPQGEEFGVYVRCPKEEEFISIATAIPLQKTEGSFFKMGHRWSFPNVPGNSAISHDNPYIIDLVISNPVFVVHQITPSRASHGPLVTYLETERELVWCHSVRYAQVKTLEADEEMLSDSDESLPSIPDSDSDEEYIAPRSEHLGDTEDSFATTTQHQPDDTLERMAAQLSEEEEPRRAPTLSQERKRKQRQEYLNNPIQAPPAKKGRPPSFANVEVISGKTWWDVLGITRNEWNKNTHRRRELLKKNYYIDLENKDEQ